MLIACYKTGPVLTDRKRSQCKTAHLGNSGQTARDVELVRLFYTYVKMPPNPSSAILATESACVAMLGQARP